MPDVLTHSPTTLGADSLAMAEYARQSFHLARGGAGRRGEIPADGRPDDQPRVLWCRRAGAGLSSMLCAILESGPDDFALVDQLLAEHRPDGAIIRRIGALSARPGLRVRRGGLLLSMGSLKTEEILLLGEGFDSFVAGLRKVTRAHIRSSLRHATRLGVRHELIVGERTEIGETLVSLAGRNLPKPMPPRLLADCLADVNAQALPFRSELRDADGALISVVLGYLDGDHAMLVCQLNPHDAPKIGQAGCSLLHRALLIRALIGRGSTALIMVNGCSGMLRPYCRAVRAETLLALPPSPISWLRCLAYVLFRPYLWTFLFGWPPPVRRVT